MIEVIVKRPNQSGERHCIRETAEAVAELIDAEQLGTIDVLDQRYCFDEAKQTPEMRAILSPAFRCGFDTRVTYRGKQMQIKQLRGAVAIAGINGESFADAPKRMLRVAEDIQ